jgi:aquaporin Z
MIPWQKYLIEFIGTLFWAFWLGLSLGSGSPLWPLGVSLGVIGLIYAAYPYSEAHVNPAYTLAVLIMGRMSWRDAGLYALAQSLGAMAGAGLATLLVQDDAFVYELVPVGSATLVEVLTMELLLSFVLVLVGLMVMLSRRQRGNSHYGLAIGGVYLASLLVGWEVSRAVINPALGLGVNLISGAYEPIWYYLVAPLLGGSLAGLLFRVISPEDLPPPRQVVREINEEVLARVEKEKTVAKKAASARPSGSDT